MSPTYPRIRGEDHRQGWPRLLHAMMIIVTVRLFVAIWPDRASWDALAPAVQDVQITAPDVRWQPPERWHLTLAFLGLADPEQAVQRIDHTITGLPAPGPIRLANAGTFGPVIWVGVDHGPWLAEAAKGLQRSLRVADRRFRAHLTVGRVRGPGGPERAREVAALLSPHIGPTWTPSEVTLVESTTGPAPEYRIRGRWPLAPPGPAAGPSTTTLDTPAHAVTDSAPAEILEEPWPTSPPPSGSSRGR